ncbi:MAG: hypothetical protein H6835_19615 [Planctomycetes bacterium]|nr:hypothetical protein [Planctomycetota bacterium]
MLRSPSLSLLLATLSCAASLTQSLFAQELVTQSAAERCAAALLRGDVEAAAAAASSAEDPAERARLQAAVLPPSQRPLAMLGVAARHRDSREADLALLAGAAAIAVRRDHGRSLPELRDWIDFEDIRDDTDDLAPAPLVVGLWRELAYRREHGGDLQLLAETERLLREVSVSRFGFEPVRVAPTTPWVLPERREDLLLRAWRRQPGRSDWAELADLGRVDVEQHLPLRRQEPLAALSAGDWLVELSSTSTRWRSMRAVEVSDLDVVAIYDRQRIALGAWRDGTPVDAGRWWWRRGGGQVGAGEVVECTFAGGSVVIVGDDVQQQVTSGGELFVEVGGQRARVPIGSDRWWHHVEGHSRWQAHLMVDRPLYRPGETVLGRLVLRETVADGDGLDAVLTSRPAAWRDVELRALEHGDEVRLTGRTDADGVWRFEVPLAEWVSTGAVPFVVYAARDADPDADADGVRRAAIVYQGRPCTVASFRRAACTLDVEGPKRVPAGDDAAVALVARWASGAPASGLAVEAEVQLFGIDVRTEKHSLVTGEDGRTVLELPLQRTRAARARATFHVDTPDGRKRHVFDVEVVQPPPPTTGGGDGAVTSQWRRLRLLPPALAIVGQPCQLRCRGPANGQALLAIGRGTGTRLRQLQFDAMGEAVVELTPTRAEWPALDLRVANASWSTSERVPLLLGAANAPVIELPQRGAPGSTVECRVATGVAGAIVTVAVVDERVFAIAEDRTPDPAVALRPSAPHASWRRTNSAVALAGEELLASLLVDGRVPPAWYGGSLDRGTPASGGPASAAGGAGQLRSDFRSTAAFVTVIADAAGVAVLPIALPDDLTTWRVTVVGATPDGAAFVERRSLVTRLPLAAEPVLPRVLRVGDAVQVPVVVDRGEHAAEAVAVDLSVRSEDAALLVEGGAQTVTPAAGRAATAAITLRGAAAGPAPLALEAVAGALADRSRRVLDVQPDAVARPLSAAAMGEGEVVLELPAGFDADSALSVSVLGGSNAAWAAIERRLQVYPYGCVEQTLSKLLPFAAAARGAVVHGTPPPTVDGDFEQRLRAGFARLRRLQHGRGGAFSFWPDEPVDRAMSALVLHGLAVMRDGGVDPARHGLTCDPSKAPFAAAIASLTARAGSCDGVEQLLDVELAAACLRFVPLHASAGDALRAALAAEQQLPAGLLARSGLALAAAGDRESAERCLQRLRARERVGGGDLTLPGERPLAVRALQLELQRTLHPDADVADEVGAVLLGCLDGYSSTYEQGAALGALALALERSEPGAFAAQLQVGEACHELRLTPEDGYRAERKFAMVPRLAVRGPAGQLLVLRVTGRWLEAGSMHEPWSSPLLVERSLCRRRPGADGAPPRGDALLPVDGGDLRVGEPLLLRVRVSSSRALRYVVVECPLPAGMELVGEPAAIERFDDRIAWSCGYVAQRWSELVVPVVPTLVGTMAWPPATAAPMYAAGDDGGTAGALLTVHPATVNPTRRAQVACFRSWRPPEPPAPRELSAREQFDEAAVAVENAFVADDERALELAWAAVVATHAQLCRQREAAAGDEREPDDDGPAHVLDTLTDLLEEERGRSGAVGNVLRRSVHAALAELQVRAVHDALLQFERVRSDYLDCYSAEILVRGLACWADRQARESLLARVLELAMARGVWPADELEQVPAPVLDEELRAVLIAALAAGAGPRLEQVLEILPPEDLEQLSPTVWLAMSDGEWPDRFVRRLLGSELGRGELRRVLADPQLVAEHAYDLIEQLPEAWWDNATLAVLHELDDYREDGFDAVARLATSRLTDAELLRELGTTDDATWCGTLALALRRRGVRDVGDVAVDGDADPERSAWLAVVALGVDDGAGAAEVLARLRQQEVRPDARLAELLSEILLRSGSVAQLAPIVVHLEYSACAALLARLDPAQRRQLLAAVEYRLAALPRAADEADGEALWSYAQRLEQLDEVVYVLCDTDAGLAFLGQRTATIADERVRESVRERRCSALGYDPDTGEPWADEPWLALLHTVARGGVSSTWSAAERQRYDRLRMLRGVR